MNKELHYFIKGLLKIIIFLPFSFIAIFAFLTIDMIINAGGGRSYKCHRLLEWFDEI